MLAPKISVIIPAFNAAQFIGRTIETVLAQSLHDFEVIVVNDGSTDTTPQQVEQIKDSRLKLVSQPNGGVSSARNRGVREALISSY